jgi:hypothetical protein
VSPAPDVAAMSSGPTQMMRRKPGRGRTAHSVRVFRGASHLEISYGDSREITLHGLDPTRMQRGRAGISMWYRVGVAEKKCERAVWRRSWDGWKGGAGLPEQLHAYPGLISSRNGAEVTSKCYTASSGDFASSWSTGIREALLVRVNDEQRERRFSA